MSTEDSKEVKGKIHQFETFGSVDGPGIRFIIFVQGCPMRCQYCHNPETWDFKSGEEWTAQAVIEKALHYKEYWGTDGGITVSGGEPLAQIDFLLALFKEAKKFGIHTNIDTSGATFTRNGTWFKKFEELMQYTMGNCITLEDTNGNRKLYKPRHEQKIDAVAAMMDAYVAYKLNREAFE